jgi:hypothetical protein
MTLFLKDVFSNCFLIFIKFIRLRKTGPKNTKFKQLLYGTEEQQKEAKILPESFVLSDFITDSKNKMKITELMSKYNLTLYQIRELRKQHNLTTKTPKNM